MILKTISPQYYIQIFFHILFMFSSTKINPLCVLNHDSIKHTKIQGFIQIKLFRIQKLRKKRLSNIYFELLLLVDMVRLNSNVYS